MRRAPIPPPVPWHPDRPHVQRAYRVDPDGETGPTPGQAAGRFWRAVGPGWFRPSEQPTSVEQRIVEASYRLPSYGGVTGWAALRWCGGRWFEGRGPDGALRDVPLAVHTANRSHRPGVLLSKEKVRPHDLAEHLGLRVTTAPRSVAYEMRHAATLREAVIALDMACYNDLVSIAEVRRHVKTLGTWTGVGLARAALDLADENSWSPAETGLRLTWTTDTGLGPVLCNRPVFDVDGRHLVTPDLLDVEAGVAGEYQGEHHFHRDQRRVDVEREQRLRAAGLEYVEIMGGDTAEQVVARLRATYARAARMPAAARRWTLERPPGWIATDTVDQRRSLSRDQRRRLLGRRVLADAA